MPASAEITGIVDMRIMELLAARLCHELIGPIAAINNGVELLGEDDPDFLRDAVALVGDSARRAGNRLQFYRFAYGFGRIGGISGPPPHELAAGYFAATRIGCDYGETARALPLDWQKLACNLLLLGGEALPRGGSLMLSAGPAGPQLEAAGPGAGLAPELRGALDLATPVGDLTSRTVHAYFTGLLARELGCAAVSALAGPDRLSLSAAAAS